MAYVILLVICLSGLQGAAHGASAEDPDASSIPEGQMLFSACGDDSQQTFANCMKNDGGVGGTGVLSSETRQASEIYSWHRNDTPHRITDNGLIEHGPVVWSPDRSRFLVSASPSGDWEECRLYLVRVSDGSMRAITRYTELACPSAKDWSRDGRWILMSVYFHDGPTQLYKVRPDGSGLTDLTCFWSEGQGAYGARWIDDGRRIVYQSEGMRNSGIKSMASDGSDVRWLVKVRWRKDRPRHLGDVEVAPDGRYVAYVVHDGRSGSYRPDDIFIVTTDGSHRRRITRNRRDEIAFAWSPDGRRLAITEGNAYEYQVPRRIRILDLTHRSSVLIKDPPEGQIEGWGSLRWSPSGRYIAFSVSGQEGSATYVSSTLAPEPRRVTPFGSTAQLMDWTR
jgi:Tol biopolymer transport system component